MHNIGIESSPCPVDEMWFNQNQSKKYICKDPMRWGGFKVPTGKGSWLIICHAGYTQHGFIENNTTLSQSKCSGLDYYQEMNSDVFREWILDLLKKLEELSVIVMDIASYHSCLQEKILSTNRKADIVAWLQKKKKHSWFNKYSFWNALCY